MTGENYARENGIHARYKDEINRRTVSDAESKERLGRIEQFASEGFFPLITEDGEMHPYLYTR
ncbi:hypothetical protein HYT25_00880 [Candidatus Pacearchaeota archaeon]|nr:hypothetical protein [Candidatus Pacearchaeota archaeon]